MVMGMPSEAMLACVDEVPAPVQPLCFDYNASIVKDLMLLSLRLASVGWETVHPCQGVHRCRGRRSHSCLSS